MVTLRKRKLKNGDSVYFLDYYLDGKRYRDNLGIVLANGILDKEKHKLAEECRRKKEIEIISGEIDLGSKRSFYDFFEKHEQDFELLEDKKNLVYNHMKSVKPVLLFDDIDEKFWKTLKNYFLIEKKHSPYTVYTAFIRLKSILNYAVKLGYIKSHKLKYVVEHKPDTFRSYLSIEEMNKLAKTPCNPQAVKNAFLFSCYTGLRYGDIEKLRFKDIVNNQVQIIQEKTKRIVYVPLSNQALMFIPDLTIKHKPEEKVFPHLAKSTIHKAMKVWLAHAGIDKNIVFHSARHTFATLALTYGVGIETVSALLGHRELRTTQIYAKIIDSKRVEAVNSLPNLEELT